MAGNLGSSSTHSGSLGLNRDQERKRVGYMRELAENYIEAVEDVVRDSNLEVSAMRHTGNMKNLLISSSEDSLGPAFEKTVQ